MERKKGDSSHGDARSQRDFGDSARTASRPILSQKARKDGAPCVAQANPSRCACSTRVRMASMRAVGRSMVVALRLCLPKTPSDFFNACFSSDVTMRYIPVFGGLPGRQRIDQDLVHSVAIRT
jgi:hypothetical protein